MTSEERVAVLAVIVTRNGAGRHFTAVWDWDTLNELEGAGLISIDRPVHEQTGIPYAQEYYSVEVTSTGQDLVDGLALGIKRAHRSASRADLPDLLQGKRAYGREVGVGVARRSRGESSYSYSARCAVARAQVALRGVVERCTLRRQLGHNVRARGPLLCARIAQVASRGGAEG